MLQSDEIQEHAAHGDGEVREYRIFGPPGTGKTTNLSRQVRRAAERFGSNSVLVTSFSKAAAAELTGRDLPVPADRVGTLHAHCYRALGNPDIAEANVDDWNKDNPAYPLTPSKGDRKLEGDESAAQEVRMFDDTPRGDLMLQLLNKNRGLMRPECDWSRDLMDFALLWKRYKESAGLLDFTDLIDRALVDTWTAPGNPSVIFADEAQDLNRMQLTLIRRWGERAHHFIICADDDQTIYEWTGASPEAVLDPPVPDDHIIVLKQSYRVPRAVHTVAESLIRTVSRRQTKEYLPRDWEGCVSGTGGCGWAGPERSVLGVTEQHLGWGQSVMYLASCGYMLSPYIAALRRAGIPYHNPYRKTSGTWNPLSSRKPGSSSNRVLAMLAAHPAMGEQARPWTFADVHLWTGWMGSQGVLKRGAKRRIAEADQYAVATVADLDRLFEPGPLESLLDTFDGDQSALLSWWQSCIASAHLKRLQFPLQVVAKCGTRALATEPKVIVGTIHSVKGGEADVVILVPDLSTGGHESYYRRPSRDAVTRLFYVGLTRARDRVYVCSPESHKAIHIQGIDDEAALL